MIGNPINIGNKERIAIIAKGSGFSHSFSACNTKSYYIAKILQEYGQRALILSSIYYQEKPILKKIGKYKGVLFYAPSCHTKTQSKIIKAINKFSYTWKVIAFLISTRLKFGKSYYIFDDNSIFLPFLIILSWFSVVELIFNIEEWPAAQSMPFRKKIVAHLFVLSALKASGKIVCVSSFLIGKAIKYSDKSKLFKLPSITAFSKSITNVPLVNNHHDLYSSFLYCGNVGYYEVIDTIISAFNDLTQSRKNFKLKLVLILSGDSLLMQKISDRVEHIDSSIKIITNLTDSELREEYAKATCLLAPLRNSIQDQARFPQKISEYASMSKPIITTKVGDIDLYFESDKSALLVDSFSAREIQRKMEYVIDNLDYVCKIGIEGNVVGRKYFDYKAYVSSFGRFITS